MVNPLALRLAAAGGSSVKFARYMCDYRVPQSVVLVFPRYRFAAASRSVLRSSLDRCCSELFAKRSVEYWSIVRIVGATAPVMKDPLVPGMAGKPVAELYVRGEGTSTVAEILRSQLARIVEECSGNASSFWCSVGHSF
jgi:hypothetical protein